MTVQAQFVPREYDVFTGLDVDKKSMAVSFTDRQQLKQALRLPYSAELLLSYGEIDNVRSIAGFLGLVSSEHSTGRKQNRGSITRAGDSRLRNKLIQSACNSSPMSLKEAPNV